MKLVEFKNIVRPDNFERQSKNNKKQMIVNDFDTEVILETEKDLLIFLNKRPAYNSNHFILTFNENGFPQLSIFVKDNYCVIYFLEENGDAFVSCGESKKSDTEIFYENKFGSEIFLAEENIISLLSMTESAKQFLNTKNRPCCIEWTNL